MALSCTVALPSVSSELQLESLAYCRLVVRGVTLATRVVVVEYGARQSVIAAPIQCAIAVSGDWAHSSDTEAQRSFECACIAPGVTCSVVFHSVDTNAILMTARPGAIEFTTSEGKCCTPARESLQAVYHGKADEQSNRIRAASEDSRPDNPYFDEVRLAESSTPFMSNSILLIPDLLTKAECHVLMDAAEAHIEAVLDGSGDQAIDGQSASTDQLPPPRKPAWLAMAGTQALERLQIRNLGHEAEELSSNILKDRILPFFEQRLPEVARDLFGQSSGLREMALSFSPGEPAVNKYTTGGDFKFHSDQKSVTVNVLLSEPGAFIGGGTAFWTQDPATVESDGAQVLLRPPQGTGVVFNGLVKHSGREVESGTRHLYVASFDLDSVEKWSRAPCPDSKVLQRGIDFERLVYARVGLPADDEGSEADPVWELRANPMMLMRTPCESMPVPGVPGAFLVGDVLNRAECETLIGAVEQMGFSRGTATAGMSEAVRTNEVCVVIASDSLVAALRHRLSHAVPRWGAGGNARSTIGFVNRRLRCYRYRLQCAEADGSLSSQFFGPHYDGAQKASYAVDGRLVQDATLVSQMSVLLYLTEGHVGGDTVFCASGVRVQPRQGTALCFWHGDHLLSPLHEGAPLKPGGMTQKYVIRTDVLFDASA